MSIGYTNYTNLDTDWRSGYSRGNRLVRGWFDDLDLAPSDERSTMATLEWIFARHNRDDRPDGKLCPSMSIGDVVVLGETAWTVTREGFERIDLDLRDLVPGTWLEAVRR